MKKIITVLAVLVPSVTMAQGVISNASDLTMKLKDMADSFITILMALAVIFIIWHVVMYIFKSSDEEARKAHRSGVIWGIIGLAIIVSIWGLVGLLTGTFQFANNRPINPPVIPIVVPR